MIFAGHYPRQHFDVETLLAMPAWKPGSNDLAPQGWNRGADSRGKPLAFYVPYYPAYVSGENYTLKRAAVDKKPHCVVRPVVRVKASSLRTGRALDAWLAAFVTWSRFP